MKKKNIKRKKSITKKIDEIIKIILGILFLIIGLLGLILPILPGWILIFIGLIFLGNKKVKKFWENAKKRI